MVTGSLAALILLRESLHSRARPKPLPRKQTTVVVTEEKRKVYPYSIVPGGAGSVREAQRAMSNPAVRDHYAAIDLKNLKQVVLTSDLMGYVSYRYGDKIYWTAKKIRLKTGETVFTDGQHIVRGRCLNCYSAVPMMPTRRTEPSEEIMNSPIEVPLIALAFPSRPLDLPLEPPPALPPPLGDLTPVAPILAPTGAIAPGHGGGGGGSPGAGGGGGGGGFPFIPIIPIIPPIHRHHSPTSTTPTGPILPPPPPAVVPEPSYRWLVAAALLVLLLGRGVQVKWRVSQRKLYDR